MSSHSLPGKVVVVGGGAKNLGGLISRDLASDGVKVVVHYNSNKAAAEATLADITASGGEATTIPGDLTQVANVTALLDAAIRAFVQVGIAINATSMVIKKHFPDIVEAEFNRIFAINSKAACFFMQEAGNKLSEQGKLCTIVTPLLGAYTGYYSIYVGSKAPVERFTRAAAKEFGPCGISVNAIAPGPMETPFFHGQESDESSAYHRAAADLSKFTKTGLTDPEDIKNLVRFIVTDGWWITGQTILANGGYTTK